MSDIAILRKMIKETSTVSFDGSEVKLEEPELADCSITIHGMPDKDDVIVIKADTFKSLDTIFNGKHGECKRADFIIVANTNSKRVIICLELKKKKDDKREVIQQLMGAKCFIVYCQEIGKQFWEKSDLLNAYQYRFVSIDHISIAKRKTRIERTSGLHDRPDRMLKISSPKRLEFNHLAGKR